MSKNLVLWVVIIVCMVTLFNFFNTKPVPMQEITYSEFIERATAADVKSVEIQERNIVGEFADGEKFATYTPDDPNLVSKLSELNVQIKAIPPERTPWYLQAFLSFLPILLIVGVWIFFMRQMQGGAGGKAFSFGKSRARMLTPDQTKVTFKDVAGADEAKDELEEVVEFLKEPGKFQKLGGKIPKGVLLIGSPGTGKTLLARAVAGEAGVPFFTLSGSDFVEMFVGVGASRVRDLFEQGKKNAPCIIFMDEIDAVGRHRGAGLGGGHDEREQTLNALLVEMDGFESTEGVILLAATNRPDVLDPALLRPGRFDRQVIVPVPDVKGRLQILKVHTEKTPLGADVNLEAIAKITPGFAGADLANLVNEAALAAARNNKSVLEQADFDEARDKVSMGKERRSLKQTEEDKKVTAYHEAGHAIVAQLLPKSDVVHKVTIVPRGRALGVTTMLPEERFTVADEYLRNTIAMTMGGRAAEQIVYNHYSSGARNDIEVATNTARDMVKSYGMSEKIGPLSYAKSGGQVFLGKDMGSSSKEYSEDTAIIIDSEVKKIVTDGYNTAVTVLTENRELLEKMTESLMEKETIDSEEVASLIERYVNEKWREVALKKIKPKNDEAPGADQ